MMTKKDEISALRLFAVSLGPDSYLGPALLDQRENIAAQLASDFLPDVAGIIKARQDQAAHLAQVCRDESEKAIALQSQNDAARAALANSARILAANAAEFARLETALYDCAREAAACRRNYETKAAHFAKGSGHV